MLALFDLAPPPRIPPPKMPINNLVKSLKIETSMTTAHQQLVFSIKNPADESNPISPGLLF